MATKKELLDRWKNGKPAEIDKKIYDYSIEKSMNATRGSSSDFKPLLTLLADLPFREEIKNRIDFRGSSFPGTSNMDLSDCDFSYCPKIGVIKDCTAKNALFDHSRGPLYELTGRFSDTSFTGANIGKAWMGRSVFGRCNFDGANLKSAKMNESDLRGSSFRNADLKHADLQKSDLRGCDFNGADLTGAVLLGIKIDKTTDLRGAVLLGAFCEEQRDNSGNLVIEGTDLRTATYDDTTKFGEDPSAFDRELLRRIVKEAKKTRGEWATALDEEANSCLKILAKNPSFKWHDCLMEALKKRLDGTQLAEADDAIRRASLSM